MKVKCLVNELRMRWVFKWAQLNWVGKHLSRLWSAWWVLVKLKRHICYVEATPTTSLTQHGFTQQMYLYQQIDMIDLVIYHVAFSVIKDFFRCGSACTLVGAWTLTRSHTRRGLELRPGHDWSCGLSCTKISINGTSQLTGTRGLLRIDHLMLLLI